MDQGGNQSLVANDICVQRMSHMKVDRLENIYEMLRESRLFCGVEMWRIVGMGENKLVQDRSCRKMLTSFRSIDRRRK
jgi:hypothetical protein